MKNYRIIGKLRNRWHDSPGEKGFLWYSPQKYLALECIKTKEIVAIIYYSVMDPEEFSELEELGPKASHHFFMRALAN